MLLTNICILMSLQLIIYFDYIDLISVTTLPAEIDLVPKSGDSKEASIEDLVYDRRGPNDLRVRDNNDLRGSLRSYCRIFILNRRIMIIPLLSNFAVFSLGCLTSLSLKLRRFG